MDWFKVAGYREMPILAFGSPTDMIELQDLMAYKDQIHATFTPISAEVGRRLSPGKLVLDINEMVQHYHLAEEVDFGTYDFPRDPDPEGYGS